MRLPLSGLLAAGALAAATSFPSVPNSDNAVHLDQADTAPATVLVSQQRTGETIRQFGDRPEVQLKDILDGNIPIITSPQEKLLFSQEDAEFVNKLVTNDLARTKSWEDREAATPDKLNEFAASGMKNARLSSYIEMVNTLRASDLDVFSKAQIVNAYFSHAIHYDDHKASQRARGDGDFKTTYELIASGMGVCGDVSHAKYSTLKAVGVPESAMRLVSGFLWDPATQKAQGHSVLMVNADGRNLVLNMGTFDDVEKRVKNTTIDAGWVQNVKIMAEGERFVPVVAHSGENVYGYTVKTDMDDKPIQVKALAWEQSPSTPQTVGLGWSGKKGNMLAVDLNASPKCQDENNCSAGIVLQKIIENAGKANISRTGELKAATQKASLEVRNRARMGTAYGV